MAVDKPNTCNEKESSPATEEDRAGAGETSVIDLAHLARQTLGDEPLAAELLGLFEDQAGRIAERLIAVPDAETKTRIDLAHTLRGSALAIGAFEVARLAQAYEAACAAGPTQPPLAALAAAVAEARAAVGPLLARRARPSAAEGGS